MGQWAIGIDPGLDGALALVGNGKNVVCVDTPAAETHKGKRIYPISAMRERLWLLRQKAGEGDGIVFVEDVHSMPKQGVVSTCSLCRGLALWEGLLAGMQYSYVMVRPQAWKRYFGLLHSEKDEARVYAQKRFPMQALNRKKDHNRADALLIATFGWEVGMGKETA